MNADMGRFTLSIGVLGVLAGCSAGMRDGGPKRPAVVNHPVFVKLKNPADAADLIADCDDRLASIPGVVSYYCGTPLDTGRENVDLGFDVGIFVGFMSEADYAAYVVHPNHVGLVADWRPRIEWLRVHDVLDGTE